MAQRRVAIISENKNISRLIEAELELMGFFSVTYEYCDESLDGFFAVICDCTEKAPRLPRNDAKIKLAITKRTGGVDLADFTDSLVFPFSLQSFRGIMLENFWEDTTDEPTQKCLVFDKTSMSVKLHNTSVKLTEYEFIVLDALCKNSGKCVMRTKLSELLDGGDSNIADVYISHLRKKLEEPFGVKIIYSIRGKGYTTDYMLK